MSYLSSAFSSAVTGMRLTDMRGENLSLIRRPFFLDALAPCSPRQQRDVLSRAEEIPRQIAAEHARAEY